MAGELKRLLEENTLAYAKDGPLSAGESMTVRVGDFRTMYNLLERATYYVEGIYLEGELSARQWLDDYNAAKGE